MEIVAGAQMLRPWQSEDAESLSEHLGNPSVTNQLLARHPSPYTVERAQAWIDLCALEAEPVNFAISDNGHAIGGMSLYRQRGARRRSAEVGFWLGEPFWGRGIATAALGAFVTYSFKQFDLSRIYANVLAGNTASIRVLEKTGFRYEGTMSKSAEKQGQLIDELLYALIR